MSEEKNIQEEIEETAEAIEEKASAKAPQSKHDDVERYKAESNAGYISGIVALLLTLIFYSAQYFIDGTANYSLCATVFGMLAAEKIAVYVKLKGTRNLILSILYVLLAVSCAVMTFVNLLK